MSALFDLAGRHAVVTGGGSGIGLAMARGLGEAGATVSLWGRRVERLDEARAELEARGVTAHRQQVDVSVESQVRAAMDEAVRLMGAVDVVVVNAGMSPAPTRFTESTTDDFRTVVGTNLEGAYTTMREAARVMSGPDATGGSMIAVSSLAAIEGAGRNQAYGATKGGLVAMANGAAVELARHGIRVNSVLPGWIATDMTAEGQASDAFSAAVIPRVPLRRWGDPDDFAGIAVYLASDASRYQTGSSVVIDGGYSIF
jgi:NAD(P)-dependent dehydrogenase (short-subunit alcohol dehydrogenase family)